jgi:serine/threonine-protein kinase
VKAQAWSEQDILEQLGRVLSSSGFVRNERMSRFLRFLVERHLQGRDDELKESVIAVEVFHRKPDYDPKQDSIVRTEAGRLRARLAEYYTGEGSADPVIIELPKGGYIPMFRRAQATREVRPTRFGERWRVWALAGVVVFAAAVGGWWAIRRERAPIPIAVLPLESLSQDSGDAYFADGLTDEIIRNLSAIEGLAVRSRTSVFTFKNKPQNVREAGTQLEADYLLEGSILRAGQQLRINARLIRVRDDFPVWSGHFDRTLTDVFAIQDEISRGIANQLRLNLGRGRWRYETSVDAYDLYLRARALSLRDDLRPPGLVRSIEPLEQAIARDPAFAPAYAALATAYAFRSVQFPLDHPTNELLTMRTAAQKAIDLDPLLAEAHEALAMSYAREGQWEEAEKSFHRAIELDPSRSNTHFDYGYWFLMVLDRVDEALQQLRVAEKTDPLSPIARRLESLVLISAGRYDQAIGLCRDWPANEAFTLECLGRARLGQGKIEEAVELLARDPALPDNPQSRGFLGNAYARAGRRDEAEKMAKASTYPNEQVLIFAGLGDKDRTLEALNRMAALGPQRVGLYLGSPELALLRDDPRLKVFRQKLGLPA